MLNTLHCDEITAVRVQFPTITSLLPEQLAFLLFIAGILIYNMIGPTPYMAIDDEITIGRIWFSHNHFLIPRWPMML